MESDMFFKGPINRWFKNETLVQVKKKNDLKVTMMVYSKIVEVTFYDFYRRW